MSGGQEGEFIGIEWTIRLTERGGECRLVDAEGRGIEATVPRRIAHREGLAGIASWLEQHGEWVWVP